MNKNINIILAANVCWYLFNFRKNTIKKLLSMGYEITVIATDDHCSENIESLGCNFIPIKLDISGKNPFKDIYTFIQFFRLYLKLKPDLILNFTPKINIYSTLAASLLGIHCINNIAGLGTIFVENGIVSKVVSFLYSVSQPRAFKVFFQNPEDKILFNQKGWVKESKSIRIMGSGVDLEYFQVTNAPDDDIVRFLFIGRILKEKGIQELIDASKILKRKHSNLKFLILGPLDTGKKDQPNSNDIEAWEQKGLINYLGFHENIIDYVSLADCVVLPSYYREGVPRSLLEAAAMGKPIITTDTIGCRETVDDGINGFICKPKDPNDLSKKMELIIKMDYKKRVKMGLKGRQKIEKEFDEQSVIDEYIRAIEPIISIKSQ